MRIMYLLNTQHNPLSPAEDAGSATADTGVRAAVLTGCKILSLPKGLS